MLVLDKKGRLILESSDGIRGWFNIEGGLIVKAFYKTLSR